MKIKILKQVNALVGGEQRKLEVGEIVDAAKDEADNLVRGGYASYQRRPATKVTTTPTQTKGRKRSIK